jgi:hypothetical protein
MQTLHTQALVKSVNSTLTVGEAIADTLLTVTSIAFEETQSNESFAVIGLTCKCGTVFSKNFGQLWNSVSNTPRLQTCGQLCRLSEEVRVRASVKTTGEIGDKAASLTLKSFTNSQKSKGMFECDCGKKVELYLSEVLGSAAVRKVCSTTCELHAKDSVKWSCLVEGQKINKLTFNGYTSLNKSTANFTCDCGVKIEEKVSRVWAEDAANSHLKSCGCSKAKSFSKEDREGVTLKINAMFTEVRSRTKLGFKELADEFVAMGFEVTPLRLRQYNSGSSIPSPEKYETLVRLCADPKFSKVF